MNTERGNLVDILEYLDDVYSTMYVRLFNDVFDHFQAEGKKSNPD